MPEEKIDFKKILIRSRDEIARDEILFAQAKAKLEQFLPKTDAEHLYLMGLSRQKAIYPMYRALRWKNELTETDRFNFQILRNQLAEATAMQGKFFRAAKLHLSSIQSGEYLEMGNAVKFRRFAHPCEKNKRVHAPGLSAKGVLSATRQAISEVYLPHEKREVVIFKCFLCKKTFAEYK